ncbi:PAB-dependent poly(A)-specific ribonuclease subunit PAN2 [Galdieria sulphuraria]|nr:PAB-dependent poly(A)-specific ribonuclease subunit PAN2 [Galdieria sulphuraria]
MELVSGPLLDQFPFVAGHSRQTLFDPEVELLWSSTVGGQLASYRCADLSRYSSIQVCYPDGSASSQLGLVRDFTISSHLIFAATCKGLRTYSKGCLLKDDGHKHPSLQSSMRCVVLNPFHQVQVFCANDTGQGMLVDSERFRIIRQENMSSIPDSCITTCSWNTQALVTGDSKGKLSIREPASFRELLATCAFLGPIFDISTSDYQIAVAGMSSLTSPQAIETNVKLFDIRKLYPLQTIFAGGVPLELKLDIYGTTLGYSENKLLWILNSLGVLECFNISDDPVTLIHSIVYDETMNTFITSFDVSEMGPIALADSTGMFHIWSYTEQNIEEDNCSFRIHSIPIYPKEPVLSTSFGSQKMDITNIETAMLRSSFAFGQQDILCDEPERDCFVRRNTYRRVDPKVLTQIHKMGKFSFVPVPSSFEQNDSYGWIEYIPSSNAGMIKNQEREEFQDSPAYRCVYTQIDLLALQSFEGFDYTLYNKSPFCGLENGLPNSYVNSVIQSLFFLDEFREYVIPLHRIQVEEEYCLMDELSLLFQMMKVGSGEACEASNFMRAFQRIPNTTALGLLDGPTAHPIGLRIESFIRYMLEQLSRDEESFQLSSLEENDQNAVYWKKDSSRNGRTFSIVEYLFGNQVVETFQFMKSFSHSERTHFLWSFHYQTWSKESKTVTASNMETYEELLKDFPKRLEASFCEETRNIRAYNEVSGTFESCTRCKYLMEPSDVLLIGCSFADEEHYLHYWFRYSGELESNKERWSDEGARARAAKIALNYGQDIPHHLFFQRALSNQDNAHLHGWKVNGSSCPELAQKNFERIYDLHFVIAFVPKKPIYNGAHNSKAWSDFPPVGHLVLYVRETMERTTREHCSHDSFWWCINDFCITRCQSISEVTRFHPNWKLPVVLGYKVRKSFRYIPKVEISYSLADIYQRACSVIINPMSDSLLCSNSVASHLFPPKGSYIALDAEFVETSREVAEIHGDVFSTMNSSDSNFVVLMDDYLVQREHVVDYLTKYSGLTFEDLNPNTSKRPLTTLKAVYMKLRCLIDNGCILIGHGLKKDFRIINFIVPKSQVIDTVELYRLPRQRLLSLRFLAATLLHEDIQGVTHDSVEDAQTAWRLFFYYQKLQEKGLVPQLLEDLYKYGREHHWQYSLEHPFVSPIL